MAIALCAGTLLALTAPAWAQQSGDTGPAQAIPTTVGASAAPRPPPPPVPVSVLAVPFPISGAVDDQVALVIEMGGKAMLANLDGATLAGQIDVAATDASGKVVDQFQQVFALDATDELIQHSGLKLYAVLRVAPGDYTVKASVRNTDTRGHGETQVRLHAPDFARREAALSPPLFADHANRWRVFRQSDSPHEELPFPFVDRAGGGFLPAASPVMPPAGAEVVVYAYGPLTDAQGVTGQVLGKDGKPLAARVEMLDSSQGRFAIERRVLLRVTGPIPEGSQRLVVSLSDSAGSHDTGTAVAVVEDAPPVVEAAASAADAEPQQPVEVEPALPAGWTNEQLSGLYQDVLAKAAAGDPQAAAVALADLEVAATPERSEAQLKGLRKVEASVLERATRGARELLPVIDLAAREDAELLRRNESWMAAQNRIYAAELLERWVKANDNTAEARHLAAQTLAMLGSSTQALVYEPANELALLRIAVNTEKGGALGDALQALQALVKAHPESVHGRLRLAMVLHRQEQDAEATRMLTEIMNDHDAPRWMSGLACQQLAEMAHAKGERDRADTLLRQGIEKIGLQSLYVQLAYYLDERQRPDDAVAILNGMPISADAAETSGRYLYNSPPRIEIEDARKQVEARAAGEWPQLRAALAMATVSQGSR